MSERKLDYDCESNDNKIRIIYENGVIDELWFQADGEDSWTVIGYEDIKKAIKSVYIVDKLIDIL